MSEEDIRDLKDALHEVDLRITVARSNGLFKANQPEEQEILTKLASIRANIRAQQLDYGACMRLIEEVDSKLQVRMSQLNKNERFVYVYGGEIWFYLLTFLFIVVVLYLWESYALLAEVANISIIAVYAAVWGVIGGISRGIWWLWVNTNRGSYRVEWRMWYFSSPFLGGIFGAIVYLLIVSSLVIITEEEGTVNNPEAIYFFAVFAGFNWAWFMSLMKSVANAVHSSNDDK